MRQGAPLPDLAESALIGGHSPALPWTRGPLRRVLQPWLGSLLPDDPGREWDRARPALPVRHGVAWAVPGRSREVAHGLSLRRAQSRPGRGPEDREFGSTPLGIAVGSLKRPGVSFGASEVEGRIAGSMLRTRGLLTSGEVQGSRVVLHDLSFRIPADARGRDAAQWAQRVDGSRR